MKDTHILTTECPYCGTRLSYAEGESDLRCPVCDHMLKDAAEGGVYVSTQKESLHIATAVDTPEAALAYLCDYFEGFDAAEFAKGPDLTLPHLAEIAEVCKLRHADRAATWVFEFGSILLPLKCKLDALEALEEQVAEEAADDTLYDSTSFDEYYGLLLRLLLERESLLETLSRDVAHAEQYEVDADELAGMKEELSSLQARLQTLPSLPRNAEEMDAVIKKRDTEWARVAAKLYERGIDAEASYQEALSLLSTDVMQALSLLEPIVGYRDARAQMNKINRFFAISGMYRMAGGVYIVRGDSAPDTEEEGADKTAEQEEVGVRGLSLYHVQNGTVEKRPALQGLTAVLAVWGKRLYYVYRNTAIYMFDAQTGTSTELDRGAVGDYVLGTAQSEVVRTSDARLYIKKKLDYPDEKKGCFSALRSLFSRKQIVNHDNNYALLCLDLKGGCVQTALPGIIDVMLAFRDKIFFKFSEVVEDRHHIRFCLYDTKTAAYSEVLSEHADIHAVLGEQVVYSLWDPNDLNLHLHVLDMANGETRLLERNVYDVLRTADGRVYYTVGNANSATLFSISLEGGDRRELMKNPGSIFAIRDKWIYVLRTYGRNRALIRVSVDGGASTLICAGLERVVRFMGGRIYYLDMAGSLRVVRTDGQEDRMLAYGIATTALTARSVLVDRAHIYYLQREYIGKVSKGVEMDGDVRYEGKYSHSLYRMDLDGRGLCKLAFDVAEIAAYDEDTIYLYKKENVTYRVTTPVSKKKVEVSVCTYPVTRYMVYDKPTERLDTVYAEGSPEHKLVHLRGCFVGKNADREVTYEVIPTALQYKAHGKKGAGAIDQEKHPKK